MDLPAAPAALKPERRREAIAQELIGRLGLPAVLAVAVLVLLPLVRRVHIAKYDAAVLLDVARNIMRTGLPLRSLGPNGIPLLDHTSAFLAALIPPSGTLAEAVNAEVSRTGRDDGVLGQPLSYLRAGAC